MKLLPLAVLAVLLLAGCTFTPVLPSPSPDAASPSASPSPSFPLPSPAPTEGATPDDDGADAPGPADDADTVSCRSLLDPATLDRVDRNEDGLQFWDDIGQRMIDQGSALAVFVDSGGIVCQIGFPGGDNSYLYAHAKMTDQQITVVQTGALAEGKVREDRGSAGIRYCAPPDLAYNGEADCYLFRGDTAFYSSSEAELAARVDYAS